MDLRKVKKLIELLEDSALVEMEITEGDSTIRLSRASQGVQQIAATSPAPAVVTQAGPAVAVTEVSNQKSETGPAGGQAIESPMVGTFYASPTPDDPPFVEVGQKVNVGDVVCIIEAMKTFNQIQSDVAGTVVSVEKSNGDPVEFGERLFSVE
ncbi:MAG: acetyl-CoA carboxylase biotin carboxyl carrier protein [Pseudomonadota bacterium]